MKAFGEAPPGWIIGYGRFEGKRFVIGDEIVVRHLTIRKTCNGHIAYQTTPDGETVDRRWIPVPFTWIELDGDVRTIT